MRTTIDPDELFEEISNDLTKHCCKHRPHKHGITNHSIKVESKIVEMATSVSFKIDDLLTCSMCFRP